MPHLRHPAEEDRVFGQRSHRAGQNFDAVEQQAERKHRQPQLPRPLPPSQQPDQHPRKQDGKHPVRQPERHQLGRHGGAHIGSEHHGHGLRQLHQPGADEPDDHHRGGRAALQHRCDQQPRQRPGERCAGDAAQEPPHPLPCRLLQRPAHVLHPKQKQRQPTGQPECRPNAFPHVSSSSRCG